MSVWNSDQLGQFSKDRPIGQQCAARNPNAGGRCQRVAQVGDLCAIHARRHATLCPPNCTCRGTMT